MHVGDRDVEAAAGDVDSEVLPEVRQLQRRADRVRLLQRFPAVNAVKVEQQAANRIRRAPAVVEQFGAVSVGVLHDILLERAQEVGERRDREAVQGDRLGERTKTSPQRSEGALPDVIAVRSPRYAVRAASRSSAVASPSSAMSSAVLANR